MYLSFDCTVLSTGFLRWMENTPGAALMCYNTDFVTAGHVSLRAAEPPS